MDPFKAQHSIISLAQIYPKLVHPDRQVHQQLGPRQASHPSTQVGGILGQTEVELLVQPPNIIKVHVNTKP